MPDYEHQCTNEDCKHEWEDTYSIHANPPTECPKCHQQTAKRVISLGGRGVVELTGQELVSKLKADAKQIQKDASRDANKYASLLGEDRYHKMQTQLDRRKK